MARTDKARWHLISPLLDELLDTDEATRSLRLAQIRRDDAPLADDLAQLLSKQTAADRQGFLEGSAVSAGASLAGLALGGYTLDRPIGHGGMGSVWLAHRSDGRFEGQAAVKFLNLALLARGATERFEREGSFLARLAHPHIACLLDAGVAAGGQPYLLLEYIEGETIDRWCDAKALGVAARIRLFLDVLGAVAHAHSKLILHRDLKPSNILVTHEGQVKLLDFGIAKFLHDEAHPAQATELTQLGGRAFTPDYAAPEQVQGEDVTTATDVYALGVLLYVLLGGQHPTSTDTQTPVQRLQAAVDAEPARLSDAVLHGATVPPVELGEIALRRAATPLKLAHSLRGDLDNIVAKALKKNPLERYATAAAMADDLRRYLNHEPVSARADSLRYRAGKFIRRHRLGVAASCAVAFALLAGSAGTLWQAQRAERQALHAQEERDRALRELTYAEAANEFMNFLLTLGSGKPFSTAELLARAERQVVKQFAADPVLRARLQLTIGVAYGQSGDAVKAQALIGEARASAGSAADASLSAMLDCELANVQTDGGQHEQAAALFSAAVERLLAAPVPDRAALAMCLTKRGELEGVRGDAMAAIASGLEALRQLGTARPGQRTLAVDAHTTVAVGYAGAGRLAESIRGYESAIRELEAMGRERTALGGILLNNMAAALSKAGQFAGALDTYRRAFEVHVDVDGAADANPLTESNYAALLFDNGRALEAVRHFEHALGTAQRRGQTHWGGYIQLNAAPALCSVGDFARCAKWLEAGRETLSAVLPPGHAAFGAAEMNAGYLATAQGRHARAREHLAHAVQIARSGGEPRPGLVLALSLLARGEQRLGDLAAAIGHADEALAAAQTLASRSGFERTAYLGIALAARGHVLHAQGNSAAARPVLEQALVNLEDAVQPGAAVTQEARALLARIGAP